MNATTIQSAVFVDTGLTNAATTEPQDPIPECGNNSPAKSVWYSVVVPRDGTITMDTFDSDYDTILSAYTGACGTLSPVPGACNDDDLRDGAQSQVVLPTTAGVTYYLMISAYENDGGTLMLHFRFRNPISTVTPARTSTRGATTPRTPTPPAIGASTKTPKVSPAPTPKLQGDANCDGRADAADLPALARLIAVGSRASCRGDDANGDGKLNSTDFIGVIEAIFER